MPNLLSKKIFGEALITAIPRGSGNEAAISRWLQERARASGFAAQTDKAGNLVIRLPGTAGYESAPTIVLQGHMDMVCEKTPDSPHDFTRDPTRCLVEGEWLQADRTTLGADNGIALALAPAAPGPAAAPADTLKAILLLNALPHGVAEMSATMEGFVETSCNLAKIEIVADALYIVSSQRSTVRSRLEDMTARVMAVGLLAGADATALPAYPGWEPDPGSPLLQRSVETYRRLFGVAPKVQMIHAGLECGRTGNHSGRG
jgi:di/tripeptidase